MFLPAAQARTKRGTGDEEQVVKVWRKRKRGNSRLGWVVEDRSTISKMNLLSDPEILDLNHNNFSSTSSVSLLNVYLLDSQSDTFGFAKLPKSKAVLGVFLHNLKDSNPDKAAGRTTDELKDVWRHL